MIQTRWHRDDLTGRRLGHPHDTGHRWSVAKFPARAEGCAEWPDEYFTKDMWFDEWPRNPVCRVIALDPSKGTDFKFGDYSAFVVLMFAEDGKLYVDADLQIRHTALIVETAIDLQRQYQADWFGVEVNQFQQLLANDLRRVAHERRIFLPIHQINNQVNKLVRIRRLTPFLSHGMFRFKGGSKGARLLVEQLRDFPNGDHDDGPDALEMAMRMASSLLRGTRQNRVTHLYV